MMTPEAISFIEGLITATEQSRRQRRSDGCPDLNAKGEPISMAEPREVAYLVPRRDRCKEDPQRIQQALATIGPPPKDRSQWMRVLWAIKDGLGEAGEDIARDWSKLDQEAYTDRGFDNVWFSDKAPPGGITVATLYALERTEGGEGRTHKSLPPSIPSRSSAMPPDGQLLTGAVLTCASAIVPEPISWLWSQWIARGKVHLLAGAPGMGKTTITMALASTVSAGGRWPDGSKCGAQNVVIWTGEDDPADTLVPRLMAAGASMERVFFVTGTKAADGTTMPFDPARDLLHLTTECLHIGDVGLVIVDPIVSGVTGDSHKNTEVRRAMQQFVDMASDIRCAVVGITHFSKGSAGRDPTERVTGSVAFGAVARVVLVVAKEQGQDGQTDRRILARAKSNIGPDDGGFEYGLDQVEVAPGVVASCVRWGAAVQGTARELLAGAESVPEDQGADSFSAASFLREALAGGAMPVKVLQADTNGAGCSWNQVKRAATRLGVVKRKVGMAGGWLWSLPPKEKVDDGSPEGSEGSTLQRPSSSPSSSPGSDHA